MTLSYKTTWCEGRMSQMPYLTQQSQPNDVHLFAKYEVTVFAKKNQRPTINLYANYISRES